MKKLRYGIASTATIVPRFVGAINQTQHSEAYAIASRSMEKATAMATKLAIGVIYDSYQALLHDSNVDVVYIASINEIHYEQVKQALMHKKHVVCEKPFVLHQSQAQELFDLAKTNNCFLMEAQKAVFLPVIDNIKGLIASKRLGDLKQIDMTQSYMPDYPENHWMYDKHQGGSLFGSAAYPIELMMHVLDQPDFSYQIAGTKRSNGCLENIAMSFVCNEKTLVCSRIAMNVFTNNMAYFYFEEGYVAIHEYWKARTATVYDNTGKMLEEWSFPCPYEMVYEIDHIWHCISNNLLVSDVMTPEITIRCVEVVEKMSQQADSK